MSEEQARDAQRDSLQSAGVRVTVSPKLLEKALRTSTKPRRA